MMSFSPWLFVGLEPHLTMVVTTIFRSFCSYKPTLYIWLVVEPTPLKNIEVTWDDEIPQANGEIKVMLRTTH